MNNVFVLLFFSVTLLDVECCTQRFLRSWLNPDCGTICKDKNLTTVHLRADGPNDTLHYLWDFNGNPSILLALTSTTAVLNINWEDFFLHKRNSITFTEDPIYTFGVVLNKIVEFNDLNDTALINITNSVNTNVLHPKFFQWERRTFVPNNEFVALNMEGNSYNDTAMNISRYGSIKLSMRGFCSLDHSEAMPHMLHTENSTQVDIILDNIQTNKSFSNSRFAVELLVVGEGNPDIPLFVDPKKSLDDEHTPGIFEVVEVRTPPYNNMDNYYETQGAYLQWRPVSYTNATRDVTSVTDTIQYPPIKISNRMSAIKDTMLYCYYGDKVNDMLTQSIIVSLGAAGDGFYNRTCYSTWTFLVGYGTPPAEKFSYLVIMILSIGLCLPLLILIASGVYLCVRRWPKRGSEMYLSE